MEVSINKEDELVMKLLHFFITEKGYSPIVLHGAKNEVWLENLNGNYEIVRIVSDYIHNDEQFDFDMFKTQKIVKKIKQKTLSLNVNTLSIFLNLGDNVNFDKYLHVGNVDCVKIAKVSDLFKYDYVKESFPDLLTNTKFKEKGVELFFKLTQDISERNENESKKAEDVFSQKKPIITYLLIGLCFVLFLLMYILGNGSEDAYTLLKFGANYAQLIRSGEIFRLITSAFLHIGVMHIVFNMYALYIVGPQIENFYGKAKFVAIYLLSALAGSLMSMIFVRDAISAGASGAIFGLFGSLLYFGYHYRIYLGNIMRSQVIPLIILNLFLGFIISGIDVSAHIGGLIAGILSSMALGVKYKSTKADKINGWILLIMFFTFIGFLAFNVKI